MPPIAFQEHSADCLLESLDALAERRLRQVQALCRATKVQFLGHGDEAG
jgi:hypothetical protein